MKRTAQIDKLLLKRIQDLAPKEKEEVLSFIEFLRIREDQFFIDYVNERTKAATAAKRRGERFISLDELQREYA
jgi:hypothetical protein